MMKTTAHIALVAAALALAIVLLLPGTAWAQSDQACWGQVTKVFAQVYGMGQHASEQETPRLGLRNLARVLYEQGVLEDDSMQSLARFLDRSLDLAVCR
jgi:hypothetical protein